MLEISDLGSREIVLSVYRKQRRCELICVFVFVYAKSRFSHDAAHIDDPFFNRVPRRTDPSC